MLNLILYSESGPVRDELDARGLARAMVPIAYALEPHLNRHCIYPADSRVTRESLQPGLAGKVTIINPVFGWLSSRLDSKNPRLSRWLYSLALRRRPGWERGKGKYVLAVIGANYHALLRARLFAATQRARLAVYLVDDLTEPHTIRGKPLSEKEMVLIREALHGADVVFCITQALADRVAACFNVARTVALPLPYIRKEVQATTHRPNQLIYIGAINYLYASALKTIIEEVSRLNETRAEPIIVCLTASHESAHRALGPLPNFVQVKDLPDRQDLLAEVAASCAAILPYSFEERHRIMVETSFPSKLLDYLNAARNIVVHAPSYSSVAAYFKGVQGLSHLGASSDVREALLGATHQGNRRALWELLDRRHSLNGFEKHVLSELVAR